MAGLKDMLAKKLSKKELVLVPSSFDIVGDIVIFNKMPKELKKKEKMIAETLMAFHKNIKVVAKKVKKYAGKLRTPKIQIIAGEKRKETIHKENGVQLKLDVEKCYFSTRLSTERLRIAKLVKPQEKILVLFSGVAPYNCVIAKNSKARVVYGIELNKTAYQYAMENIKRNKLTNVKLLQGDVKKILPRIKEKFDRIILPLPKKAEEYLPLALKKLKQRGTIHLYLFAEEKTFSDIEKRYKEKFRSVNLVPCGAFGPHIYRVCLDLKH